MKVITTNISGLIFLVTMSQCPVMAAQSDFRLIEVRAIDGTGNNLQNPTWGSAGVALLRSAPAAYLDGVQLPSGADRPGARLISNSCAVQVGSQMNAMRASDFLWQWGQFIDHDIGLTPGASPPEPFDIDVPAGDTYFDPLATGTETIPFNRSTHRFVDGIREQMNVITAYIDGSMIYGSDEVRAAELRTLDGTGRLKTSEGDLLPYNENELPNDPPGAGALLFLAGDIRANEQVGLTAMHTLFVREHNFWAAHFAAEHSLATGEDLYQLSRAIVAAEIQIITYNEFLPVLLGADALPPYEGYQAEVNAGIANEFSTGAFRVGHTMLSPVLLRSEGDGWPVDAGNLDLADAFFDPTLIPVTGIEPVLRGLASQPAQEADTGLVDGVRNFLFGEPGNGGFDLAALNIQRGRDHGLPSYNDVRVAYGLSPRNAFEEITSDPKARTGLSEVYGSPSAIDLWVGGLAEDHMPGSIIGEVFASIISDQFERLRDGDRFWYESHLPESLKGLVIEQTLAKIIRRNTSIEGELQDDVFMVPPAEPLVVLDRQGQVIRVAWPGAFTDMVLQMATDLDADDWTDVPAVGNGMTMSLAGEARFFRLVKR